MIFFDLDDTLLDDRTAMRVMVDTLLRDRTEGVEGYPGLFEKWWELADTMYQRSLAGEPGYERHAFRRRKVVQGVWPALDEAAADRIVVSISSVYKEAWRLFPDVLPCLAALAPERFGVITNGQVEQQVEKLDRLGIRDRFAVVVVSSDAGFAKPDARIFHEACRRAGELPAACWMVGDRIDKDPLPSTAAGLRGVWLNRDPAVPADPRTTTIRSLAELPALIRAE